MSGVEAIVELVEDGEVLSTEHSARSFELKKGSVVGVERGSAREVDVDGVGRQRLMAEEIDGLFDGDGSCLEVLCDAGGVQALSQCLKVELERARAGDHQSVSAVEAPDSHPGKN